MNVYILIFLFAGISIFLCLAAWVLVCVYRICYPGRPLPFNAMRIRRARLMLQRGRRPRTISAREIRMTHHRKHEAHSHQPFRYLAGEGNSVPDEWREELWERRN